jgi:hypothetical protein
MHPSASAAFAAFASTASVSTASTFIVSAAFTSASDLLHLPSPPPMHASISLSASASAASAFASDRKLHAVNSFRTWIYYPIVLFPQSVTDSLMETDDRGENDGRRKGNSKENSPLSYIKVHPQMASEK